MLHKTQTYVAMVSMMGAGMLFPIGVEAVAYSPVIHTDVSQLDWSKNPTWSGMPSARELQEAGLKELLRDPQFQILPPEWQKVVIENVELFYVDDETYKSYVHSPMLDVIKQYNYLVATPSRMDVIRGWIGLPQPEEPLNPKTGKRYVQVPKNLVQDLSPQEILYVKKVLNVVNQNLHYLNSLPPYMDPEKMEKGEYLGYAFVPLTLVQPKVLYEDSPSLRKYYGMREKSHQDLVAMFSGGDEELYRLQSQLGTPLYNLHLIDPDYKFRSTYDCFRFNTSKPFGIRPIILGYCDRFNYGTLYAYRLYFQETQKSFPIMRAGMAAEVAAQMDHPKLHKTLIYIQKQTERYLTQMEQATTYMRGQVWPDKPGCDPLYQDVLGIGDRLLEIRVPKDVDDHVKTEKKLTPKEKRLLKKQERKREKELKKQQRQRDKEKTCLGWRRSRTWLACPFSRA